MKTHLDTVWTPAFTQYLDPNHKLLVGVTKYDPTDEERPYEATFLGIHGTQVRRFKSEPAGGWWLLAEWMNE